MARKKIREYDSKRLLKAHITRLAGLQLPIAVAQVKENTNFAELIAGKAPCWPAALRRKAASVPGCAADQGVSGNSAARGLSLRVEGVSGARPPGAPACFPPASQQTPG